MMGVTAFSVCVGMHFLLLVCMLLLTGCTLQCSRTTDEVGDLPAACVNLLFLKVLPTAVLYAARLYAAVQWGY